MPLEIEQPELATYTNPDWFFLNAAKTAVVFRANHDGATTPNSSNPRCELREMTNNGLTKAGWDGRSGRHVMEVDLAVTRLDGSHHVVVGQIHGGEDDVSVFRLEGSTLWATDGDTPHGFQVTSSYVLGTRIKLAFDVQAGTISYRYNGQTLPYTHEVGPNNFFKCGCYLQVKQNSGGAEVQLYGVKVTHS